MTEQEMNKACEWLEKYMESLGYIDEWCRNGEDAFRKAMEAVVKENLTPELTLRDVQKIADIIGHTSRLTRDGMIRSPKDFYSEILERFKEQ